jgi:hypothetical protein
LRQANIAGFRKADIFMIPNKMYLWEQSGQNVLAVIFGSVVYHYHFGIDVHASPTNGCQTVFQIEPDIVIDYDDRELQNTNELYLS